MDYGFLLLDHFIERINHSFKYNHCYSFKKIHFGFGLFFSLVVEPTTDPGTWNKQQTEFFFSVYDNNDFFCKKTFWFTTTTAFLLLLLTVFFWFGLVLILDLHTQCLFGWNEVNVAHNFPEYNARMKESAILFGVFFLLLLCVIPMDRRRLVFRFFICVTFFHISLSEKSSTAKNK